MMFINATKIEIPDIKNVRFAIPSPGQKKYEVINIIAIDSRPIISLEDENFSPSIKSTISSLKRKENKQELFLHKLLE